MESPHTQGQRDHTASDLLEALYGELRALARARLEHERHGHTLQPTALVHEAYMRLVAKGDPGWDGRAHFFAAAAEAMRRILIEHARAKRRLKRGGGAAKVRLDEVCLEVEAATGGVIEFDEALKAFERLEPDKAMLVKLRVYAGLSLADARALLELPPTTADRHWAYAKAWLQNAIREK